MTTTEVHQMLTAQRIVDDLEQGDEPQWRRAHYIEWLTTNMVIWYEPVNGDGVTLPNPCSARLHHRAAIMLHGWDNQGHLIWNALDGEGVPITRGLANHLLNHCGMESVWVLLDAMATLRQYTPQEVYKSICSALNN